ncbi:phosphatidylglycerol lysyltransferase domain-containing protein [Bacillus sp. B15-48]|uniref:phosphatidylglycerol lysyltransferase domain-containing protein n=1 Tax=Bacillus sp. B15-48 TaxID=1548601 RepID=UPI00193FF916|nr:phosphatidylglycerol lysyltransferase domain-containing protein [Bacillus sp. B15-48]MBM4765350.1 DUF2156 domain-containing protein [Bacillus sp. B15-48]
MSSSPREEMILGDWTFHVINIKDKEMYEQFIIETKYPTHLWSSSFDYVWAASNPKSTLVLWKIVDGLLVTFKLTKKKALQLPFLPFGSGDAEKVSNVLLQCLQFCQKWNQQRKGRKTVVRVVTDRQLDFLRSSRLFHQYFRYVPLTGDDRHISVQKLIDLSGAEFNNVRYCKNKFLKDHPNALVRRANRADFQALLNLKQEWNNTFGKKYTKISDELVYEKIIKHHEELNHIILVVELHQQIIGMISGGVLPHGEAWGSLLKQRQDYYGLSEFLYVQFADEIHKVDPYVKTINLGIDSGPKGGLRRFKDKFRPVYNASRYRLSLKSKF